MKINKGMKNIKNIKYVFLLGCLFLFHLINNYIWLRMDTMPLIWDAHKRFMESLRFFEEYRNFSWSFFSNVININRFHPIFVSMITSPFYAIFGRNQGAGVMINSAIFFGILILSVYGIGKKLDNRQTGLVSAFIVTMYPIIFNQSRIYLLDLPLTAMVSLCIYLLLCTNNFENRRYSILFGVALGFSLLTKLNFIGFIIAPFLFVAYKTFSLSFKETKASFSKADIPKRKLNFAHSLLLGLVISSIYYLPIFIVTCKNLLSSPSSSTTFFSTRVDFLKYSYSFHDAMVSFWWYFQTTVNNGLTLFFFVIFAIGLYFFLKRKLRDGKLLLLLWVIIPFILLTFVIRTGLWASTELRYIMPALPSVAIISAIGVLSIPNRILKGVLVTFVFLFGLFQFFAVSYGIRWLPEESTITVAVPRWVQRERFHTSHMLEEVVLFRQDIDVPSSHYSHSLSVDWGYEEIFEIIKNNSEQVNRRVIISVLTDTVQIWGPLQYRAYIEKLPFDIFCDAIDIYQRNIIPYPRLILEADYIITKKGGFLSHPDFIDKVNEAINFFNQHIDRFILLKKIKAPDGSVIFLYKNKELESPEKFLKTTSALSDYTDYLRLYRLFKITQIVSSKI